MGDTKRFQVTADFIARNFVPCRVADVGGGKGDLSTALRDHGFICTVINTRKAAVSGQQIAVSRIRAHFTPDMATDYDLLVGLHPDGATEALAQAALSGMPVVIVPCCHYWRGIDSHGSTSMADTIRRYWRKHHVDFWETQLPMSGKNLILIAPGTRRNHINCS